MKMIKTFTAFIVISVLFSSCKKDKEYISYPVYGDYGENILQKDSLKILSSGDASSSSRIHTYSVKALLPIDSYVKLIFKKKSTGVGVWFYNPSTKIGWAIDEMSNNLKVQKMFAYGQNVCDFKILFTYTGEADIEIYENNDTIPKRIKRISW